MSLACIHSVRRTILTSVVMSMLGFAVPSVVFAQSVDARRATEAQALFDQASAEMDAGQFASACKKLEEVTRLVPDGVGAKYSLGECYENIGKLASAWTQYSFAEQVANRLGQTERAEDARAKAEALKPKLATMAVSIPDKLSTIPNLVVRRDGIELREPQWGTPVFVDVGRHEIEITAPGYTTWKKHAEVLADGVAIKFEVPENAIMVDPDAPKADSVRIVPVVVTAPMDRSWQRPAGIISTGIGATTIISSLIVGGLAFHAENASNSNGHCDAVTNQCDDQGLALRDRALFLGNVATGLFIAGSIVAVGGGLLSITAPNKAKARANHETRMGIHLSPTSFLLIGTF